PRNPGLFRSASPRPRAGGALYRRRPTARGLAHVQRTLEPHMSPNPAPAGTADGTRSGASAAPKRPRPKKTRSEGQWAKGYREPLNPVERFKRDDAPLNVRDRITDLYAELGHGSIDQNDLRGRFRWMGLYTQRAEGYDGTYTGDDNADLLESKYFMMR